MKTFSRRLTLSALQSLYLMSILTTSALTISVLTGRAQPPDPPKTATEIKNAQEPEALPLVTWNELQKQIGGPTLVTLHAKEMPIVEVIDALGKQSPVPVNIQNRTYLEQQNKKTLTADYEKQPFWKVARDIADKLDIGLQNYGGSSITFTPWGEQSGGVASVSEAAIFNLSSASYSRYVGQGKTNESRNESLYLNCTLMADPKLQWQNNGMAVHLTEALDDKNQSLLPTSDSDIYSNGIPIDMNMQLKARDTHGGTLKRLRGTFHGAVAFVSETWEVPDILKAKNVEKIITTGETTTRLELQDVTRDGDDYRVVLIISQNGTPGQQRTKLSTGKQIWMGNDFQKQPRLVDDAGRDLQMRSSSMNQEGNEGTRITTFTCVFYPSRNGDADDRNGEPTKLILPITSDWRELIIPFEFTNVNLP